MSAIKNIPQRAEAIALLLQGEGICAIAAKIGVDRSTVSAWAGHDEQFKADLEEGRRALLAEVHRRVVAEAPKAVSTLTALLGAKTPGIRLSAARALLTLAGAVPRVERAAAGPLVTVDARSAWPYGNNGHREDAGAGGESPAQQAEALSSYRPTGSGRFGAQDYGEGIIPADFEL